MNIVENNLEVSNPWNTGASKEQFTVGYSYEIMTKAGEAFIVDYVETTRFKPIKPDSPVTYYNPTINMFIQDESAGGRIFALSDVEYWRFATIATNASYQPYSLTSEELAMHTGNLTPILIGYVTAIRSSKLFSTWWHTKAFKNMNMEMKWETTIRKNDYVVKITEIENQETLEIQFPTTPSVNASVEIDGIYGIALTIVEAIGS